MTRWLVVLVLVVSPSLHAQSALSKTLHDPALWLNLGGNALAGGTTHAFLTGHGQSVDHPGPCVEGNPRLGPHPALGTIWTTRAEMMGLATGALYLAHLERTPKLLRVALQTVAWTSAVFTIADGARNIVHCGLY